MSQTPKRASRAPSTPIPAPTRRRPVRMVSGRVGTTDMVTSCGSRGEQEETCIWQGTCRLFSLKEQSGERFLNMSRTHDAPQVYDLSPLSLSGCHEAGKISAFADPAISQ